jgi:hypothetical protein
MRSLLRALLWLITLAICLPAACAQLRLYSHVDADDVQSQLRYVRRTLDRGEGAGMQARSPGGFAFADACYGLAWVEQGLAGSAPRRWALDEARFALSRLTSPAGRAPDQANLAPGSGVLLAGWTNWLRAGVVLLGGEGEGALGTELDRQSEQIARAFDASETPFLSAQPDRAWPVDSVVAIASLRMHDRVRPPRYQATIERWLTRVKTRLDPKTGLIPHRVDPRDGHPLETARGSSQSMLLRFLAEIDPTWAAQQYAIFREKLVVTRMGLPGVREYPEGVTGAADVESGPLVLGVSASATVVARGTAAVLRDPELGDALADTMEMFGMPLRLGGEKRYVLGVLPVGDAVIAWSQGARRWSEGGPTVSYAALLSPYWRLPSHAVTLAFIALLLYLNLLLRRR